MNMRLVLGLVLALLAFAGGVAGMYFAMPWLAPERVEATRLRLDSLARAEAGLVDTTAADTTRDSLLTLAEAEALHRPVTRRLADSLAALHDTLARSEADVRAMQERVEALRRQIAQLETRQAQTDELANTLAKLEDDELRGILAKLQIDVLERLYFEASGRNRTRLLQAMPTARAAAFVDRLVDGDAAAALPPDEATPGTD